MYTSSTTSHGYDSFGVAGGEGVYVGEDEGFGAVVAELSLVMALDDGDRFPGCRLASSRERP